MQLVYVCARHVYVVNYIADPTITGRDDKRSSNLNFQTGFENLNLICIHSVSESRIEICPLFSLSKDRQCIQ